MVSWIVELDNGAGWTLVAYDLLGYSCYGMKEEIVKNAVIPEYRLYEVEVFKKFVQVFMTGPAWKQKEEIRGLWDHFWKWQDQFWFHIRTGSLSNKCLPFKLKWPLRNTNQASQTCENTKYEKKGQGSAIGKYLPFTERKQLWKTVTFSIESHKPIR